MRREKVNILILAVCIAVVALCAALAGYSIGVSAAASASPIATAALQIEEPRNETPLVTMSPIAPAIQIAEPSPPQNGTVAIPGFDRLFVRSGILYASAITNPTRNNYYFVVAITLADGTLVFRSDSLSPGQSIGNVELDELIPPGLHEDALVRYSVFSMENMQPLNGADISFTLEVLP